MTQIDLAVKLKVTPETLSRTINGNPTLKSLKEIAKALNVEVIQLFESNSLNGFVEYQGKIHKISSLEDLKKLINIVGR